MDILNPLASSWKKWLATRVLRSASLVTTNSQFTAHQLSENYGIAESKICVVYPSASSPAYGRDVRIDIPEAAPLIACVGRLVHRKGFDLAIKAMPDIWKTRPEVHLAILGNGPELANLQKLAASLDRPSQVHFFTNPDDQFLASAYARASALAFPARQQGADVEGFGIVCLEAAAAGVPVVATSTGGIAEAVQDGQTGFLVEPDNLGSLAAAVLRVVGDPGLRHRMSEASKLWAAQFSWQKSADKLLTAAQEKL
jgi:phosphatidylinositol alpha-1,6-mannosyltransferase